MSYIDRTWTKSDGPLSEGPEINKPRKRIISEPTAPTTAERALTDRLVLPLVSSLVET